MARFKFGNKKNRRSESDSTNISVISQGDYHSNCTSASASNDVYSPASPPPEESLNYDYNEPSYMGSSGKNSIGNSNSAGRVIETSDGTGKHRQSSQFGSVLDPKLSAAGGVNSVESPISINLETPWSRHKLFGSPFPRYRHAASAVSSEKGDIYIMGGLKDGSVFGDTWKITPHRDGNNLEFTTENIEIANGINPPARVGHSSVLCGNAFIVYGGDTVDTDSNGFPDNNFYLFNINNNKYTVPTHILNKPHGRYGHTLGVIALNNQSSRLYLFGGQLENDVFNDMYYFELNTFKSPKARWETIEPLNNFKPPPLTNHSMSIYKNKIYVFGGVYNNEKVSNDLWCFDAIINKWTQITTTGAVPLPVNEHSACIISDKLFIYGGNDFQGTIYDTLYVLDLRSLVWSKLTESGEFQGPGPRCGHSMTYLATEKKLIIMGGDKNDFVNGDKSNTETFEDFDMNETVGTMLYSLDLNSLDGFLVDTPIKPKTVVGGIRKKRPEPEIKTAKPVETIEDFKTPNASPELNHMTAKDTTLSASAAILGAGSLAAGAVGANHYSEIDEPNLDSEVIHNDPSDVTSLRDDTSFQEIKPLETPKMVQRSVSPPAINSKKQALGNGHIYQETHVSQPSLQPSSEVKKVIGELTSELNNLKASTTQQIEQAQAKIESLSKENEILKEQNSQLSQFDVKKLEYEAQIQERDNLIADLRKEMTGENDEFLGSEVAKYKLDSLELKNKLVYLENENEELKQKMADFEPFMNNQITELSNFQKVIKAQEEKIAVLQNQVKDQQDLEKQVVEWKHKYNALEIEYNNFKAINQEEEIIVSDDENDASENGFDESGNKSIRSSATKKSKRDISQHLENLVVLWNSKHSTANSKSLADTSSTEDPNTNYEAKNEIVNKLQNQVDELLLVSKEQQEKSAIEINELRAQLTEKLESLRNFENNYRDALQSVNNTSKALDVTHEELEKQRYIAAKLQKENEELKFYQKSKRTSRSTTPIVEGEIAGESGVNGVSHIDAVEDDNDDMKNAHFNMKIQDLQAELFVLKQERDQLKDDVTLMKKQLYLSQQK